MTAISPYISDATPDNFNSLVLGNSAKGPVLVNYWAAKAAPCFLLMPRLIKLCTEYHGKFLLVMLDTDKFGRFAKTQGVNSVPTVRICFKEKLVDTIHGAQSDAEFHKKIDRYAVRKSDHLHLEAVQAYQRGDIGNAFNILAKGQADDPENLRLVVDHVKLLIREQRYAEASFLLKTLPESEQRLQELICLSGFIKFNQIAQNAPDAESLAAELETRADNNLARYQLSALKLLAGETEEALEYLLEIVRRESGFGNGAARQCMLTIFQTLGPDDDLVKRYRSLLSGVLNAVH